MASTPEKRHLAREHGAHVTIEAGAEGLAERILEANDGRRVDVILEMVGGEVFRQSLQTLAPLGRLVTFGATTNEPQEVDGDVLTELSAGVIGFWIRPFYDTPERLAGPLAEHFDYALDSTVRPHVGQLFPLEHVRQAHADLEGRRSVGKLLLAP